MSNNPTMTKAKKKPPCAQQSAHPYVIVRCSAAGVHAGEMLSRDGDCVVMAKSRRLWLWRVPKGKPAFLSGVAQHGLGEDCRIGCEIDVTLLGACEIIYVATDAEKSIRSYAPHERSN